MREPFDEELISAYLDGELSPDVRASVERAVERDPALRQVLEESRALRRELGDLPRFELKDEFADRVLRVAERSMIDQDSAGGRPSQVAASKRGGKSDFRRRLAIGAAVVTALAAVLLLTLNWPGDDLQVARQDTDVNDAAPGHAMSRSGDEEMSSSGEEDRASSIATRALRDRAFVPADSDVGDVTRSGDVTDRMSRDRQAATRRENGRLAADGDRGDTATRAVETYEVAYLVEIDERELDERRLGQLLDRAGAAGRRLVRDDDVALSLAQEKTGADAVNLRSAGSADYVLSVTSEEVGATLEYLKRRGGRVLAGAGAAPVAGTDVAGAGADAAGADVAERSDPRGPNRSAALDKSATPVETESIVGDTSRPTPSAIAREAAPLGDAAREPRRAQASDGGTGKDIPARAQRAAPAPPPTATRPGVQSLQTETKESDDETPSPRTPSVAPKDSSVPPKPDREPDARPREESKGPEEDAPPENDAPPQSDARLGGGAENQDAAAAPPVSSPKLVRVYLVVRTPAEPPPAAAAESADQQP